MKVKIKNYAKGRVIELREGLVIHYKNIYIDNNYTGGFIAPDVNSNFELIVVIGSNILVTNGIEYIVNKFSLNARERLALIELVQFYIPDIQV